MKNTWQKNWEKKSNFEKQEYRLHHSLVFFRYFKDLHLMSKDSPNFSQEYRDLRRNLDFLFQLQFIIEKIKVLIEKTLTSNEIQEQLTHDLKVLRTNCFSLYSTCMKRRGRHQCMHPDLCKSEDSLKIAYYNFVGEEENNQVLKELRDYMFSFDRHYKFRFRCQLKTSEKNYYSERLNFQLIKKEIIEKLKSYFSFSSREQKQLSRLNYNDDYYFITGEFADLLAENINLSLQEKIIIENHLQVLNKGNILHNGLPYFDEMEKSNQNFLNSIGKSNSTILKEKKGLLKLVKELPEKGKLKK